jgi:hypothetical protein
MNICSCALNAECDVYDGFEPADICIYYGVEGCPEAKRIAEERNKIKLLEKS